MYSKSLLSLLFSVLCLAHLASAASYAAVAKSYANQAKQMSSGSYYVQNYANKRYLTFTREGSRTNLYPKAGKSKISIEFSGKKARFSGGNNKCVSAQWSDTNPGYDHAAVSYVCAVGSTAVSSTLEKPKQWWYLVPTGKKRSGRATYYIIATDHITDMPTRSIGNAAKSTTGGYKSTVLAQLSKSSSQEYWITKG